MLCDAHMHASVLAEQDPGFPARFRSGSWRACSASHSDLEMDENLGLRDSGMDIVLSFGMHPQGIDWALADRMAALARAGTLSAIGEAGFDFYGDEPGRVRTPENLAAQRAAFEYQLSLAERYGLPLVLHVRRALDLVFEYSGPMKRLKACLFHSWSGPHREAQALLKRGVPAFFSFGGAIVNGNKKARESCALLGADRVLIETDAPFQPPRGSAFCTLEHLAVIRDEAARLRGVPPEALEESTAAAFGAVYGRRGNGQ